MAILTTVLCANLFVAAILPAGEPESFDVALKPFLDTYCLRCNHAEQHEGNFRLDSLPRQFGDQATAQRRGEVVFRMKNESTA